MGFANLADGGINALFGTPVDDYRCAFRGEAARGCETDPCGGACYQRFLTFEL
jgi:hypothetical protein